jgi:hypothetical protein
VSGDKDDFFVDPVYICSVPISQLRVLPEVRRVLTYVLVAAALLGLRASADDAVMPELGDIPAGKVLVTFSEGLLTHERWPNKEEAWPTETMRWVGVEFLLPRIPVRHDDWGIRASWKSPLLVRMAADCQLPAGDYKVLLRVRALSRLWIDGKIIAEAAAVTQKSPDGEEPITPLRAPPLRGMRVAGYHQQEAVGEASIAELPESEPRHSRVVLEMVVGGEGQRTETGEVCVAVQSEDGRSYFLLRPSIDPPESIEHDSQPEGPESRRTEFTATDGSAGNSSSQIELTDFAVEAALARIGGSLHDFDDQTRRTAAAGQDDFWIHRHQLAREWAGQQGTPAVPTVHDPTIAHPIDAFITAKIESAKAAASQSIDETGLTAAPVIDDFALIRRVYLDTVGIPPAIDDINAFLRDAAPNRLPRLVDRLLADERFADHWISEWLDMLAENPTLINQSLNSTGPFRWFLHDSLRDNKPLDRLVSELILMRGSDGEGGSAGFAVAGENDSPFAAKGHILASAFQGIQLRCARCHDSPYHTTTQRDLYSLAAMLERKAVTAPVTSRVPAAFFEQKARESLIQATLKPDELVAPVWPFEEVTGVVDTEELDAFLLESDDSRHRLAALMTSPRNRRFARVAVNRLWKRLIGTGLVEPVHDWEGRQASHPELLDWLAHQLMTNAYDMRQVARTILLSRTYRREASGHNLDAAPQRRFFAAPDRRRLTAEQIVDSLHAVTGTTMDVEELTFVHDGRRPLAKRQTLGKPRRAWMFASLNNERDRPSLSLPRARAVTDVLEAFGWEGSRQQPIHARDTDPSVLQAGVLANGSLTQSLTRASHGSKLAQLAVDAESPEALANTLVLRVLGRMPASGEHTVFAQLLADGFATRLMPSGEIESSSSLPPLPLVTWFNHLQPEADEIQRELERRVRVGPPPDPRLRAPWRERYEDIVWSLVNHREFVWMP